MMRGLKKLPGLIWDGLVTFLTKTLPTFTQILLSKLSMTTKWINAKMLNWAADKMGSKDGGVLRAWANDAQKDYDTAVTKDKALRDKINAEDDADEQRRKQEAAKEKAEAEQAEQYFFPAAVLVHRACAAVSQGGILGAAVRAEVRRRPGRVPGAPGRRHVGDGA